MSDFRAIGGVSASLRQLLLNHMEQPVEVTLAPPDVTVSTAPGRRVNLFLYRVQENAQLKNQDLPGGGSPGAYGRPPLALELYYLMTAYGESEEHQVEAHQILGDAMRALHDNAVVLGNLLDASLQGAYENVKVYLDAVSLEDLTKIWSALSIPYRLSAGYKITVVQIESRRERTYPRPVADLPAGGPRLVVVPFSAPRILEVLVQRQDDLTGRERAAAYARIGDTLILRGVNFTSEARVMLGSVDASAEITSRTETRIALTVPEDDALQPGPIVVKVQVDVMLGQPPTAHRGFQSNLGVFVLTPHVAQLVLDTATQPRTLAIHGARLYVAGKEALTLIGDHVIRSSSYVAPDPAQIQFPLPATVGAGAYPVRVRVGGVESFDEASLVVPP